jgi:large exoprotein involved in heme utilization and adhesion
VTGGQRSDIDGTLRSTIAGADFYFLNPAGVMFGPNASLDVQGSFHLSTTDELRFADGAKFSATDPSSSSFTVAAPEAFGFLAADPKPITVNESRLQLPAGEALSIVGGDIDIGLASVQAQSGRITLSAVGGPGEARLGDGRSARRHHAPASKLAKHHRRRRWHDPHPWWRNRGRGRIRRIRRTTSARAIARGASRSRGIA